MPSVNMNSPYAEAYLQMNPAVARSYYEHAGRSNYTLTSEHQKIICVIIMIALGCYVVGFAIIMIRQVIRDTQQREADGCDCVKYNGEHCGDEQCTGDTGDYLDEITDDVLLKKETILPALSNKNRNRKRSQTPIEISVRADGTYCRELPLAEFRQTTGSSSGDKFSSNKYVNEEFLRDDTRRCSFGEESPENQGVLLNYLRAPEKEAYPPEEHPTTDRLLQQVENRPAIGDHYSSDKSTEQTTTTTINKTANQQFSLIKSENDQSENGYLPFTWPCNMPCSRPCLNPNCVRLNACAMPNSHCFLAGKLANSTSFAALNGCPNGHHLASCSSLNFVPSVNCSNTTNCLNANSICLLSANRIHYGLPVRGSLIDGRSSALANGSEIESENGPATGQQTNGLTRSLTSSSLNGSSNGLLTNVPGIVDSSEQAAYRFLLNGLANSAMNRLAGSFSASPSVVLPNALLPSNTDSKPNGAARPPLDGRPNAFAEQAAAVCSDLPDGLAPFKEELNFKQTEIHTNSDERSRLFNRVKSFLVLDYPKQKQSIEHL